MATQEYSDKVSYTKKHVWAKTDSKKNTAYVGVTDFLTEELQAIDCIDLPLVGDELEQGAFCFHLHVGSRIFHFRSPLTGRCLEINKEVMDSPGLLHLDANENWLFKMEYDEPDELDDLMNGSQYTSYLDDL